MDLGLEGNAALVTASSSGLGKASAKALAREGSDVMLNGRNEERLEKAAREIEEVAQGRVATRKADITKKKQVENLVGETLDEFGTLDHLVTSAGGPPSGPFLETEDADWYDAYDLLVMSVVRTVREAAPHLRSEGGTIVHIASKSVKEAIQALVLSNSVRMSVIGLEKTLSKELAPEVRVNAVLPASIHTSRIDELVTQAVERGEYGSYEEGLEAWGRGIPLERMGDPMELGDTVAFLSSERASYINGAAIPVDGGALKSNL